MADHVAYISHEWPESNPRKIGSLSFTNTDNKLGFVWPEDGSQCGVLIDDLFDSDGNNHIYGLRWGARAFMEVNHPANDALSSGRFFSSKLAACGQMPQTRWRWSLASSQTSLNLNVIAVPDPWFAPSFNWRVLSLHVRKFPVAPMCLTSRVSVILGRNTT